MTHIQIDLSEFKRFIEYCRRAERNTTAALAIAMEMLGMDLLDTVTEYILSENIVDTRRLLSSFQRGDGDNVFVSSDGGLTLEVGTKLEYAKYVEDGHWTCKPGEIGRWVPGNWSGDRFIYDPGVKTGMYLKQRFIDGKHYFEHAVNIEQQMMPKFLEKELEKFIQEYFALR